MSIDPVSLAITAALTAAQMAMQASQKIEGPRLDDLTVTVADYGTQLNYFRGLRRFEGAPIFFAEPLKEVKRRRKTKGGKFNDYTYFGTFAVAIADHEIDGVTRIWFDKHLIYDATGAGPVTPFSIADGFSVSESIRFYLGTETQEPDPRMLATVDAAQGAGSTPAYRGVSYIFFEDIPLEKLGNRIPQVSVEAITNATPHYPYSIETPTIDPPNGLDAFNFSWSPDRSRFMWSDGFEYEYWDAASRSSMVQGTWNDLGYTGAIGMAVVNDGTIYGIGWNNPATSTYLVSYDPDGLTGGATVAPLFDGLNTFAAGDLIACASEVTGDEIVGIKPFSSYRGYAVYDVVGGTLSLNTGPMAWQPHSYFADMEGNIWCVGAYQSASTLVFTRVYGDYGALPDYFEVAGMPSAQGVIVSATAFATDDNFVVLWNGTTLNLIDIATQTLTTTVTVTTAETTSIDTYMESVRPGATTFWIDATEYYSADLSVKRTYTDIQLAALWVTASGIEGTFYDPINNALVSSASGDGTLTWRYLDRIGSDGVTLQSIVEAVTGLVSLDLANIDASALDQIITGYSWTQASGKDILDPLLDAYDSIVRPHDFTLQFKKRGDSSGGTILTSKFVRQSDSRYRLSVTQDTDLPRRVTFSFADVNGDQQTNSVVSQRPLDAANTVREQSLSMTTLATDAEEARGLSDRWFRRKWFERIGLDNALSMQLIALEPGDVRTLDLDGNAATYRLTKASIGADGVIACSWKRDDPSLAVLSGAAGAEMDGRAASVISVAPVSKGFVLDIPLLTDAQNRANPLLYYGAGPYVSGSFPGATFYERVDGAYETEWASVLSTAGLTWGYSTGVLADGLVSVWDRGHSVNVIIKNGTLASTTEATCDATTTANLALLGDELIQFTTATLEVDGSYTLSGLKRGRRGTEWATDDHAIGEKFVLLDMVGTVEMGLSDVGTDLSFKAVTQGRDADSAFPIPVTPFTGASLKPYAPALVTATKNAGTGDWTINWTRRSRIGGAWTSGTSVPLGEAAEEYEVDILNGSTVVRTISGLTTPTATYTAAQQTTDGGSVAVGDLDVAVYQISASVDRGFAAPASF